MEFTVVNYLWRKEYQMHGRGSRSVMLAHTMNTPDQNAGRGDGTSIESIKGQAVIPPSAGQSGDPSSPTPSGNIKVRNGHPPQI